MGNDSEARILLALLDQTMTVGMEELLELFDLIFKDEPPGQCLGQGCGLWSRP